MILNSYHLEYLEDAQSAPDGGFPTTTTGLPPANPDNALSQDLKLNDLRDWVPKTPMVLCGGNEDPPVFFFNTQLMQGYWATNVPSGAVSILDLEASASGADPYAQPQNAFLAAKALVASVAVLAGVTDG